MENRLGEVLGTGVGMTEALWRKGGKEGGGESDIEMSSKF